MHLRKCQHYSIIWAVIRMNKLDQCRNKLLFGQPLTSGDIRFLRTNRKAIRENVSAYRFTDYVDWNLGYSGMVQPFLAGQFTESKRIDPIAKKYLSINNWQYRAYSEKEKVEFTRRLLSVRYDSLVSHVRNFIKENYGHKYPVSGMSIFGGVLYGHENQIPDDLDLIVLLERANFTANPIRMFVSNMQSEIFTDYASRPVTSGKIGLTIIGTRRIGQVNPEENVRAFSITYWGMGVPIFGTSFTDQPPPPAANMPFPYRVMAWAYKDMLMNQEDPSVIIRSLSRIVTGVYIANYVADNLQFNKGTDLTPQEIWETIYKDPSPERLINLFIKFSRKLSQDLFTLECMVRTRALEKLENV